MRVVRQGPRNNPVEKKWYLLAETGSLIKRAERLLERVDDSGEVMTKFQATANADIDGLLSIFEKVLLLQEFDWLQASPSMFGSGWTISTSTWICLSGITTFSWEVFLSFHSRFGRGRHMLELEVWSVFSFPIVWQTEQVQSETNRERTREIGESLFVCWKRSPSNYRKSAFA